MYWIGGIAILAPVLSLVAIWWLWVFGIVDIQHTLWATLIFLILASAIHVNSRDD